MTDDTQTLCDRICEAQYRRRFYIKRLVMTENALRALVRRRMGWSPDLSEAEREKINARAAGVVAKLMADKPVAEKDRAAATDVAHDAERIRAARIPLQEGRRDAEMVMERAAKQLPVYAWVKTVRGFSALGLAVIVAEAGGDLTATPGNYPNPDKLKRRLGLAPFKGKAGKSWRVGEKWAGRTLTSAEWQEFGYDASRRAEVWGFIDQNVERAFTGKYRAIYDTEKARFKEKGTQPIHAQAHARRVVAQEVVIDLWRVWNGYAPRERQVAGDRPAGGGQESRDSQHLAAPADDDYEDAA
jgi:hypothetical protein